MKFFGIESPALAIGPLICNFPSVCQSVSLSVSPFLVKLFGSGICASIHLGFQSSIFVIAIDI